MFNVQSKPTASQFSLLLLVGLLYSTNQTKRVMKKRIYEPLRYFIVRTDRQTDRHTDTQNY